MDSLSLAQAIKSVELMRWVSLFGLFIIVFSFITIIIIMIVKELGIGMFLGPIAFAAACLLSIYLIYFPFVKYYKNKILVPMLENDFSKITYADKYHFSKTQLQLTRFFIAAPMQISSENMFETHSNGIKQQCFAIRSQGRRAIDRTIGIKGVYYLEDDTMLNGLGTILSGKALNFPPLFYLLIVPKTEPYTYDEYLTIKEDPYNQKILRFDLYKNTWPKEIGPQNYRAWEKKSDAGIPSLKDEIILRRQKDELCITGNEKFSELFNVYTNNVALTRKLICPIVQDSFVKFKSEIENQVYLSIINNIVYLGRNYDLVIFQPSLFTSVTKSANNQLLKELQLYSKFMKFAGSVTSEMASNL